MAPKVQGRIRQITSAYLVLTMKLAHLNIDVCTDHVGDVFVLCFTYLCHPGDTGEVLTKASVVCVWAPCRMVSQMRDGLLCTCM